MKLINASLIILFLQLSNCDNIAHKEGQYSGTTPDPLEQLRKSIDTQDMNVPNTDSLPKRILDRIHASDYFKNLESPYRKKGGLKFMIDNYMEDTVQRIRVVEDFDNRIHVVKNLYYSPTSQSVYEYDTHNDKLKYLFKIKGYR